MQEKEIWKDIVGYEGLYQVSNLSRIKSIYREIVRVDGKINVVRERILKEKNAGAGYRSVVLCRGANKKYLYIHRLVAISFLPNKNNKETINHKDGVKTNNSTINLEWATRSENSKHAYNNNLNKPPHERGFYNNKEKNVVQYSTKLEHINSFRSVKEASEITGVYYSGVSRCCNGKLNSAGGFIWKYKDQ